MPWYVFYNFFKYTNDLKIILTYFTKKDLKEFEETILQGVGYDKDGKISKKELTMILLTLAKFTPNEQ